MNIKKFREKQGISQRQLAIKLEIPSQYINNYELGKCEPSIETLIKIADYFNITTDELLERESKVINLNFVSKQKQDIINFIYNANDNLIDRIEAYIEGVKFAQEERQDLIQQLKKKL